MPECIEIHNSTTPTEIIDGYHVFIYENVNKIEIPIDGVPALYKIYLSDCPDIHSAKSYYFHMQSTKSIAFAHWVYECALALPIFSQLKARFPELKLIVNITKSFVKCFTRAFEIADEDVVYADLTDTVYEPTNNHNLLIQTPRVDYAIMNDKQSQDYFNFAVQSFRRALLAKVQPLPARDISVLYLPRGVKEKEGLEKSDRVINIQGRLIQYIQSIPGGIVYDSDNTTNILDQIRIILRANTIVLDWGSSFCVNGIFAQKKTKLIILEPSAMINGHTQNNAIRKMWDMVSDCCYISVVSSATMGKCDFDLHHTIRTLKTIMGTNRQLTGRKWNNLLSFRD